jgi:hypothetical protein
MVFAQSILDELRAINKGKILDGTRRIIEGDSPHSFDLIESILRFPKAKALPGAWTIPIPKWLSLPHF